MASGELSPSLIRQEGLSTVPFTSVGAVWERDRKGPVLPGFLIGAAGGALVGGVAGYLVYDAFDPFMWGPAENKPGGSILIGAGIGFVIGGITGGTISATHRPWRLRYPTPASAQTSHMDSGDSLADRLQLSVTPDLSGGAWVTASLAF